MLVEITLGGTDRNGYLKSRQIKIHNSNIKFGNAKTNHQLKSFSGTQ